MSTSFDIYSYRSSMSGNTYQVIRASTPKAEGFMVRPEAPLEVYVTHFEGHWQIVNPELPGENIFVPGLLQGYLYAAITEAGRPFVLVVTHPLDPEKDSSWFDGWLSIIKTARQRFVRVFVNHDKKRHECKPCSRPVSPNWPDIDLNTWLAKPFENYRIDSTKHPIFGNRRESFSQEGLEDWD